MLKRIGVFCIFLATLIFVSGCSNSSQPSAAAATDTPENYCLKGKKYDNFDGGENLYSEALCLERYPNAGASVLAQSLRRYEIMSRQRNSAAREDAERVLRKIIDSADAEGLKMVLDANYTDAVTINALYGHMRTEVPQGLVATRQVDYYVNYQDVNQPPFPPCNGELQQTVKTLRVLSKDSTKPLEYRVWTRLFADSLLPVDCNQVLGKSRVTDPKQAYDLYKEVQDTFGMRVSARDVLTYFYATTVNDAVEAQEAMQWWVKAEPALSEAQAYQRVVPLAQKGAKQAEEYSNYKNAAGLYRWLGNNQRAALMQQLADKN